MNNKHKKLEEKYSNLLIRINKEKETVTPPATSTFDNKIVFNIPISNSFQTLNHHESNNKIERMTDDIENNHQPASQETSQEAS